MSYKTKGKSTKYRSKFEGRVALQLQRNKIDFKYEATKVQFVIRVNCNPCSKCGNPDIYASHTYLPDFLLRGDQVILEVKGILDRAERKKFEAIKKCNPHLDIRLLFQRDNRIYKGSNTRYSDWAKKIGYQYAFETIPTHWIKEFKSGY